MKKIYVIDLVVLFLLLGYTVSAEVQTCFEKTREFSICNTVDMQEDSIFTIRFLLIMGDKDSLLSEYKIDAKKGELSKNSFVSNCTDEYECIFRFYKDIWPALVEKQISLIEKNILQDSSYASRFVNRICKGNYTCLNDLHNKKMQIITYYKYPTVIVDPFLIESPYCSQVDLDD